MANPYDRIITNTEVLETVHVTQEDGESDFAELRSINTVLENVPYYNILADSTTIRSRYPFSENDDLLHIGDVYEDNFAVVAYTGNGSTQNIFTGIESYDVNYDAARTYTAGSGNNTEYAFDRATMKLWQYIGETPANGIALIEGADWTEVADDVEIDFMSSKVWIKSRTLTTSHQVVDTLRGVYNNIYTDLTNAKANNVNGVIEFGKDFINIGTSTPYNTNAATYVVWQKSYNKIKITTTNQGKRAIVAYDTEAGRSMTLYEGSGLAGHEVPHGLGVTPEINIAKNLDSAINWFVTDEVDYYMQLNTTLSKTLNAGENLTAKNNTNVTFASGVNINENFSLHIMYSETSKADQIKIGTYTGTGAAGNYVDCGFEPEYVMIKRTDVANWWILFDTSRPDSYLLAHDSAIESTFDYMDFNKKGFSLKVNNLEVNASGGNYLFTAYAKGSKTRKVIGIDNAKVTGVSSSQVKSFATVTYTGTGANQAITTGIGSEDFTDNTNSSDYWFDRSTFNVLTGDEMLINGNFNTDLAGWITETGNQVWDDGWLRTYGDGSSSGIINSLPILFEKGVEYTIKYDFESIAGGFNVVQITGLASNPDTSAITGFYTYSFIGDGEEHVVRVSNGTTAATLISRYANISIRKSPSAGNIQLNTSKIHIKDLVNGTYSHQVVDGLRGKNEYIFTGDTNAESNNTQKITSFNNNGITLGTSIGVNTNTNEHVLYQTLYTHIRWGVTNHNKRYVEAYNPFTLENMIIYEGSGHAGHSIPHSLGVQIDFSNFKSLTFGTAQWYSGYKDLYSHISLTAAFSSNYIWSVDDTSLTLSNAANSVNDNATEHIFYGKAKSENWTIVEFTGTGAAGNYVETKDKFGVPRRPRRVVTKKVSTIGSWVTQDSERGGTKFINLDGSIAEATSAYPFVFNSTGFTTDDLGTGDNATNHAGVSYIALVEFDTNGTVDDSYYTEYTGEHNVSFEPTQYINDSDMKLEWSLNDGVTYHQATLNSINETDGIITKTYDDIEDTTFGNRAIKHRLTLKANGQEVSKVSANIWKKG